MEQKKDRFEKIALESSKQSKGTFIPGTEGLIKIDKIKNTNNCLNLVLYENEKESFKLSLPNPRNKDINIFIGLEGGLPEGNIQDLSSKGFKSVPLGNRVLRTNTVPICALNITQYELEDME